jgi:hypothetical protein
LPLLLASSSVAALLVGGGVPRAYASCTAVPLIAKFDCEFAPTAQTYSGTGTLRYTW